MLYRALFVVVLCVVGALSAPPKKVCAPDQFSAAMLGKVAQVVNKNPMVLTSRAMVSTDYKKKMESFAQDVTVEGKSYKIHQITDYNKMKSYEIHPTEKTCKVMDLPAGRKLVQYCEGDPELKTLVSFTLGGKKANVVEMDFHNTSVVVTIMADNFSPVTMNIKQHYNGIPQMLAYQYGNVTNTIVDPSMFDVPSYCMSSDSEEKTTTKRVCAPEQFESIGVGEIAQIIQGKPQVLGLGMKVSRDFKNKMEASMAEVIYDGHKIRSQTVTDFSKKTMYQFNPDTKQCYPFPAPLDEMIELCNDSEQLKAVASFKVDGKDADMYDASDMKGNFHQSMTVFRDTFEIISTLSEQNFANIPQMLAIQYGNMTKGISDPSVFTIPDYCKTNSVLLD